MRQFNKLASALLLVLGSGALVAPAAFAADGKCPMEQRQSKAVGESAGKKVQKAFELYSAGQTDQAIAMLLEINAKGGFDKAYVDRMLGTLYAERGKMDVAIKYIKQAVDADILGGTDHAQALRLYADLLISQEKYKEAIPVFYKWMEFACKTDDPKAYRAIAVAHMQLKQFDKAIEVADKGLAHAAEPDRNLYQVKLNAYYEKKQYKKAADVLETMVPLFPDPKLWVQLAQVYLLTEDYPRAVQTYDIAYRGGFIKGDGPSITRYAQLLSNQDSPYRAAKVFEKHMKEGLIEANAKNYEQLGGFYQRAKEMAEAAEYFGKAAEMTNDGKMYLRQGRLLSSIEKYSAAIPVLEKALSSGIPSPGEAQFELGIAHLQLKQYKAAYQRFKQAANDKKTERSAKSYISYTEEKARMHKVTL